MGIDNVRPATSVVCHLGNSNKKCIVFPKVLSMIDVYWPQWHRSFLLCVFARIDVISFHGELKVLKGA